MNRSDVRYMVGLALVALVAAWIHCESEQRQQDERQPVRVKTPVYAQGTNY